MRTETLNIDERFGKDYAGQYVFREISWAKRSRIIQKHTRYHPTSGQIVNSDYIAIQAETILASLKQQPPNAPVTLEKLLSEEDGLPIALGEIFSQTVNRLCGTTLDESTFLSEPSENRSPTQPSQTSDCAKNSAGPHANSQSSRPEPSSSSSSSSTS